MINMFSSHSTVVYCWTVLADHNDDPSQCFEIMVIAKNWRETFVFICSLDQYNSALSKMLGMILCTYIILTIPKFHSGGHIYFIMLTVDKAEESSYTSTGIL